MVLQEALKEHGPTLTTMFLQAA
jgi:hypothetical protein